MRTTTNTAAVFLILGLARHELWERLPASAQALAWNAAGAFVMSALVWMLLQHYRSRILFWVCAWWLFEEMQVLILSLARIFWDWYVPAGQSQAEALFNFPASSISVALVAGLGVQLYRETKNDKS